MSNYFSSENCASIGSVPVNSRIHVVGICGVAMAQISIELSKQGYVVSGSDREFYEPMGGLLKQNNLTLHNGYNAGNIHADTKLVVIGNAISSDNPEVLYVKEQKIPYTIFPKIVGEVLINDRTSIVMAGTHGKSTTTALASVILKEAQKDPSYFVGGVVNGLNGSLVVGKGNVSIVEGDEYDSAFFAKLPKFFFYKPKILVITSIEFDHADIYDSLADIEKVFEQVVSMVPEDGTIIACADCPVITRLVPKWKKDCLAKVITYGTGSGSDVRIVNRIFNSGKQTLEIMDHGNVATIKDAPVIGLHNAKNLLAVYIALKQYGLNIEQITQGVQTFKGVKRRQEIRYQDNGITVIEDFAHHPTAVKETLVGIKEAYPNQRIICVFEPRSNTSRRKVFEKDYGSSFNAADIVILKSVEARHNDTNIELMDLETVVNDVRSTGVIAEIFSDVSMIIDYLKVSKKPNDVIVIMSNGSFDGLIDKFTACLTDPCQKQP